MTSFPFQNVFSRKVRIFTTLALLSLLVLGSCNDEEAPTDPVTIFNVVVDPGYAIQDDTWIIVNDKNGKLLDYKKLNVGENFTFTTSKPIPESKIGVTIFQYWNNETEDYKNYEFRSYLAIPIGQSWTLGAPGVGILPDYGNELGNFTIEYELPDNVKMDVLSGNGRLISYSKTNNSKFSTVKLYEKSSSFLLSIAGDENPRYKFLENVAVKSSYNFTMDDLLEYDHILEISFPTTPTPYASATVSAYDDNDYLYYTYLNGFNQPPFAPAQDLTQLKIGYLDRFKKYHTYISLPGFSYEKFGTRPVALQVPTEPIYKILNKSLTSFDYSNDQPFSMRLTRYYDPSTEARTYINWSVTAPEGNDQINELPDEFLSVYEIIDISNFVYQSTTFTSGSVSYENFIDKIFKGTIPASERETISISVN